MSMQEQKIYKFGCPGWSRKERKWKGRLRRTLLKRETVKSVKEMTERR